jgi:DNA-binding MarR family transcriptional regulator
MKNDHNSLRLWLRLLSSTQVIEQEIRSRLRIEFETTLPRFDLMAQLQRHPEGLKMGELSRRMLVTSGNITGIVDQLEAEQLVRRESCPSDRRAYLIAFTDKGQKSFSLMAKAHERWVEELFAGLTTPQQASLHELLGQLKGHALKLDHSDDGDDFSRTRHFNPSSPDSVSRRAA